MDAAFTIARLPLGHNLWTKLTTKKCSPCRLVFWLSLLPPLSHCRELLTPTCPDKLGQKRHGRALQWRGHLIRVAKVFAGPVPKFIHVLWDLV